jgi:acyl-CoA thioester hydrolase
MNNTFSLDFKVRDYECDIQGIVNNSVYQNYLEHTRHEFLIEAGINFAELARKKINLVVIRAELDYKYPLRSGDRFKVTLNMRQASKIRFDFLQDIYRLSDNKLILKAKITGTALNEKGRPFPPPEITALIEKYSVTD